MVGAALPIVLAGGEVPVVLRGEPRGAIVSFLVAALWNFAHLKWLLHQHTLLYQSEEMQSIAFSPSPAQVLRGMRFASTKIDQVWANPGYAKLALQVLLLASIALLAAGSTLELISFTSVLGGESVGCPRRYTLYSLGTALVSDFALTDHAAPFAIWILCLAYFVFVGVVPWLVHVVHASFFLGRVSWPADVFEITNVAWIVASIEALLLSINAIQVRHRKLGILVGISLGSSQCALLPVISSQSAVSFYATMTANELCVSISQPNFAQLLSAMAGNGVSQLFGIQSELGPAYYILIVYCFVGGLSQYFLNTALMQSLHADPIHKVDLIWSKLIGCLLVDDTSVRVPATMESQPPLYGKHEDQDTTSDAQAPRGDEDEYTA
jgi:hypothetical protein